MPATPATRPAIARPVPESSPDASAAGSPEASVSLEVSAEVSSAVSSAASSPPPWASAPAAVTTNAGAGLSRSSSDWPSAGISVQGVSPFSHVWIVGKARSAPSASSGSCTWTSKVSR